MKNIDLLNRILTRKSPHPEQSAQTLRSTCVFDLDSTLFNVSPRTEQILIEFAETFGLSHFSKIKVHQKDWGLKEILIREGYDFSVNSSENLKLHKNLVAFWTEKFFSDHFLHYDTPHLGAVHFVQTLFKNNVDIHYLTGRDIFRMGTGTVEVLKKWGFPLLSQAHLHLKPTRELDDHKFKLEWVREFMKKQPPSKIFFFENEPVNINAIGRSIKDLEIVYLNTTHSRKETVQVPVTEIDHFSLIFNHERNG